MTRDTVIQNGLIGIKVALGRRRAFTSFKIIYTQKKTGADGSRFFCVFDAFIFDLSDFTICCRGIIPFEIS